MKEKIERFLSSEGYAVAGASNNRNKYGNKVLRCYLQNHKKVYPIHPIQKEIEGLSCFKEILDLPSEVNSLSIITPPVVTEKIVQQAIEKGIQNIWMQPGAESQQAIDACLKHNINVIAEGPCILVILGFSEI